MGLADRGRDLGAVVGCVDGGFSELNSRAPIHLGTRLGACADWAGWRGDGRRTRQEVRPEQGRGEGEVGIREL